MEDNANKTRRTVLQTAMTGLAVGTVPALAGAKSEESPDDSTSENQIDRDVIEENEEYRVSEVTVMPESDDPSIHQVKLYKSGEKEGSVDVLNSAGENSEDTGYSTSVSASASASTLIKRSSEFSRDIGECNAFSDYEHVYEGYNIELTEEGVGASKAAVAAAITEIIVAGPATAAVVAFGAFIFSNSSSSREFTVGAKDFDVVTPIHTQTMTGWRGGTGWDIPLDETKQLDQPDFTHLAR